MNRIAFGGLGALGVGLLAVLAVEIAPAGPAVPDIAAARVAPARARAVPPPEAELETAQVSAILERPLFDRSRRPSGAAEPVVGVLRLAGVVVGPSGREAIFEPVGGGKAVVVLEGQRVNGALVRMIAPGAVLMVDGNGAHLVSPAYTPGTPESAARPGASK